jgi:putative ABC transport system permease protein
MFFLRLVFKNALRHKPRTALTIVGITVAIAAFGLLRTVIDAGMPGLKRAPVRDW